VVGIRSVAGAIFRIFDLAPVGYLFISEAGLILEANRTAGAFLGEERAALARKPISQFIFPEDRISMSGTAGYSS